MYPVDLKPHNDELRLVFSLLFQCVLTRFPRENPLLFLREAASRLQDNFLTLHPQEPGPLSLSLQGQTTVQLPRLRVKVCDSTAAQRATCPFLSIAALWPRGS